MLATHSELSGAVFMFCMGFLTDIISGGILGLFTFLYTLVYMAVIIISHPVDVLSSGGRTAIIFIAVVIKNLLMAALLTIFSLGSVFHLKGLTGVILSGFFTCVISLFIFYFFNRFDMMESRVEGEY